MEAQVFCCLEVRAVAPCRATLQSTGRFGNVPSLALQSAGSRVQWPGSWALGEPSAIPFFRTGDLGRLGPDGLEILGRIDSQVKVGGECSSLFPSSPCIRMQSDCSHFSTVRVYLLSLEVARKSMEATLLHALDMS